MVKCGVLSCRSKTIQKHTNISLHKLPACKKKRQQWLDILGEENLIKSTKTIFICSLHFDAKYFNRTLNLIRLRDDAVPHNKPLLPAQIAKTDPQHSIPNRVIEEEPVCISSNDTDLPAQIEKTDPLYLIPNGELEDKPVCNTSIYTDHTYTETDPLHLIQNGELEDKPVSSSAICNDINNGIAVQRLKTKCDLQKTRCELQKRTIKRLREKLRRRDKQIADFKNLMKDLRDTIELNDDCASVSEQCAGPKDFIRRRISYLLFSPIAF